MRYIAITDIHGELEKLENLFSKLDIRKEDKFIFMGDYIDRGPNSKGVVDRVIEQSNYNECVYLIGSHEYALMHSDMDEYYQYLFENYGGPATVRSYGGYNNIFKI